MDKRNIYCIMKFQEGKRISGMSWQEGRDWCSYHKILLLSKLEHMSVSDDN